MCILKRDVFRFDQQKNRGKKKRVPSGLRGRAGQVVWGGRGSWGGRGGARGRGAAHSLKQWAADTSQPGPSTAAPQKCSPFSRRLTCQGNSPRDAATPPTILPAVLQPGRDPQSARRRSRPGPGEARARAAPPARPPAPTSKDSSGLALLCPAGQRARPAADPGGGLALGPATQAD